MRIKTRRILLRLFIVLAAMNSAFSAIIASEKYDVAIIGGGASGVSAAVQASRLGAKVVLVEQTDWLGGMLTSAGVSAIDGNYRMRAGFWGEFCDSLISYYGSESALKTGWVSNVLYEPSAGEKILTGIISQQKNVTVLRRAILVSLKKTSGVWVCKINDGNGTFEFVSKVLIDATELGDVAAMAGVTFDVGMESREETGEDIAPEKGNGIIQDLTYVAILKDYGTPQDVYKPHSYKSEYYSCCCINSNCVNPSEPERMWSPEMMINYGKLPGGKYMINWPVEGNDYYVNLINMSPEERIKSQQAAKDFTLGFIYYINKELGFSTLALADDEFPTADRLPFIPYHRESRRIHGKVRFTLPHITKPYSQLLKLYRTAIAVGDYPVDQHHARYTGAEELPDLHFYPVPSFGLPLGTLIPENSAGLNLIVAEKSISVSNIVNGTTRLQPVVMQIGTAAGTVAALAVRNGCDVEDVSVREVQSLILASGGYLLPYLDVDKTDSRFKAYQRIGATGILHGYGKNEGWTNETWLNADSLMYCDELAPIADFYSLKKIDFSHKPLTVQYLKKVIAKIAKAEKKAVTDTEYRNAASIAKISSENSMKITRGAFAVMIDNLFNPFSKDVTITGEFI